MDIALKERKIYKRGKNWKFAYGLRRKFQYNNLTDLT